MFPYALIGAEVYLPHNLSLIELENLSKLRISLTFLIIFLTLKISYHINYLRHR